MTLTSRKVVTIAEECCKPAGTASLTRAQMARTSTQSGCTTWSCDRLPDRRRCIPKIHTPSLTRRSQTDFERRQERQESVCRSLCEPLLAKTSSHEGVKEEYEELVEKEIEVMEQQAEADGDIADTADIETEFDRGKEARSVISKSFEKKGSSTQRTSRRGGRELRRHRRHRLQSGAIGTGPSPPDHALSKETKDFLVQAAGNDTPGIRQRAYAEQLYKEWKKNPKLSIDHLWSYPAVKKEKATKKGGTKKQRKSPTEKQQDLVRALLEKSYAYLMNAATSGTALWCRVRPAGAHLQGEA